MIDGTPYSVRLYAADTSVYLTIDPAQRNSGGATRHALTAGTYLVLASWSGVESFTVVPFVAGVAQAYPPYQLGGAGKAATTTTVTVGPKGCALGLAVSGMTQASIDSQLYGSLRIFPVPDYTP